MAEQHTTWYNRTEPTPAPEPTRAERAAARRIDRQKRLDNPAAASFERRTNATTADLEPAYH